MRLYYKDTSSSLSGMIVFLISDCGLCHFSLGCMYDQNEGQVTKDSSETRYHVNYDGGDKFSDGEGDEFSKSKTKYVYELKFEHITRQSELGRVTARYKFLSVQHKLRLC